MLTRNGLCPKTLDDSRKERRQSSWTEVQVPERSAMASPEAKNWKVPVWHTYGGEDERTIPEDYHTAMADKHEHDKIKEAICRIKQSSHL